MQLTKATLPRRSIAGRICTQHVQRGRSGLKGAQSAQRGVQLTLCHERLLHVSAALAASPVALHQVAHEAGDRLQHDSFSTADNVRQFYDALNRRDMASVQALLSHNCTYDNLAVQEALIGKKALCSFFQRSLAAIPGDAQFEIDDITEGDPRRVGVLWRLVLTSSSPPGVLSRGSSFFRLNDAGCLVHLTDSPEHLVKLPAASLEALSPLVRSVTPMLPSVKDMGSFLQSQALDLGMHLGLPDPFNLFGGSRGGGNSDSVSSSLPSQQDRAEQSTGVWSQDTQAPRTSAVDVTMGFQDAASTAGSHIYASYSPQTAVVAAVDNPPSQNDALPSLEASSLPFTGAAVHAEAASRTGSSPLEHAVSAAAGADASGPSPDASSSMAADDDVDTSEGWSTERQQQQEQEVAAPPRQPVHLNGLWERDMARSDLEGFEASLDVLQLGGLQRVTARLIEGLDIVHTASSFQVNFVTIVPFFKVTETISFASGASLSRRDLRPGKNSATVRALPDGVLVEHRWGEPQAGSMQEVYTLQEDGSMHVRSTVTVEQASAIAEQVYVRSARSKEELLKQSQRQNGSMQEVMTRQQQQYGR